MNPLFGMLLIGTVLFVGGCCGLIVPTPTPSECGNGTCDVGETESTCSADCTGETPSECGNGTCDVGETESTCSADCTGETPTPDDSCSSNSDCGYKQKCKSGECVTVECTSNSQCSGCQRCSDNQCVSCGSGPYGCYC